MMQYDERPLQNGLSIRYVWSVCSHKHFGACTRACPIRLSHSTTWISRLQDLVLQRKPKKQRLPLWQIFHLSLLLFSIPLLQPTPLLAFSLGCCVCLAAFPGRSPARVPCFLRARISPAQRPISENETRESGYRNAPFPPDSLSITMMES